MEQGAVIVWHLRLSNRNLYTETERWYLQVLVAYKVWECVQKQI